MRRRANSNTLAARPVHLVVTSSAATRKGWMPLGRFGRKEGRTEGRKERRKEGSEEGRKKRRREKKAKKGKNKKTGKIE